MAVKRLAPLGPLRPYKIDGMVEAPTPFGFEDVFAFSGRNWSGKPPDSADRQKVPLCWSIQTAYTTWQEFFPTINDFASDVDRVFVDPQPRWGTKGSLLRLPRAVVCTQRPPGFTASPGRLACLALATQLSAKKVFCGTRRFSVTGSHTLVRCSLPENGIDAIDETFFDGLECLGVDETQTQGGEALFVIEDYSAGADSVSPYYDQEHATPMSAVRAHDLSLLARTAPKFSRVRYLYLQPFSELVTQPAKDAIQSFINADTTNSVRYSSINGALDHGPGLGQAQAAVQAQIQDFFGL